ncbi:MAG: RNA polymerase sigma factor [Phycisphaeraceae bacterium]|nr:RNA polymerase sigma factor [Phycisphaeraceae bacterium]
MSTQAAILHPMPMLTETEPAPRVEALLIEQAKRDRTAFEPLYREHHEAIFRYLCRRTGSEHAAQDLASEVFLTAMLRIGSYSHRGVPFRAWLYRIATLKANRWARQRGVRRERPIAEALHLVGGDHEHSAFDFESAQAALLSLPPRYQAVLTLHHLEGMPVERVAQVIGRPAGTVKSRLARARRAMLKAIESQENSHA